MAKKKKKNAGSMNNSAQNNHRGEGGQYSQSNTSQQSQ
jgi:hypothetical protein